MRRTMSLLAVGIFIVLAGCNTMKGAGQDIESGGAALSNQAAETQKSM